MNCSYDITEDVQSSLLSSNPNLEYASEKISSNLQVSMEDANKLIYNIVLQINKNLFPSVNRMELILTEGCNLGCSYCFEKNMLGYKKMPLSIAKKAVDILFDYSRDDPILSITHFGGEPTLNFEAIKYATEYAEEKARKFKKTVEFHMTSNGVLINEEMADYFARHHIMVLLSLDGLRLSNDKFRKDKFGNGTFDKVLKTLDLLKKTQRWVGIKMTIMPQNAGNLYSDVIGLYALGVNQFIIGYASGIQWNNQELDIYQEQLSKVYEWYKNRSHDGLRISEFDESHDKVFFGCQAGKNGITITVDGQISPCARILALDNKQLLAKLGDIKFGIYNINNRSELVTCKKVRRECSNLGIDKEFQGGCFAINHEDNKDLFKPSLQKHKFSLIQKQVCAGCSCKS
ncbi:MAG TPA: radical SAM protein [Nitrososphaeraceae archaeon]|nr:radical SAM protein [Nitrososphaeraceae archaeon]